MNALDTNITEFLERQKQMLEEERNRLSSKLTKVELKSKVQQKNCDNTLDKMHINIERQNKPSNNEGDWVMLQDNNNVDDDPTVVFDSDTHKKLGTGLITKSKKPVSTYNFM